MKTINLKDYYPYYTQDTFVEVPDELFAIFEESVYSDSEIPSARSNRPSVTIELTHLNER